MYGDTCDSAPPPMNLKAVFHVNGARAPHLRRKASSSHRDAIVFPRSFFSTAIRVLKSYDTMYVLFSGGSRSDLSGSTLLDIGDLPSILGKKQALEKRLHPLDVCQLESEVSIKNLNFKDPLHIFLEHASYGHTFIKEKSSKVLENPEKNMSGADARPTSA